MSSDIARYTFISLTHVSDPERNKKWEQVNSFDQGLLYLVEWNCFTLFQTNIILLYSEMK
jgi:hypothetical protein